MENLQIRMLEKQLFLRNRVIPDEIWPGPEEDASWDSLPTGYTKKIKQILDELNSPKSSPSSSPSPVADLADAGPDITYKPKQKKTDAGSTSQQSQPIRFQFEGLTSEEKNFLYQQYDPYEFSQKPWEDSIMTETENLAKLELSVSSPQVTQSCQMTYEQTPSETHLVPRSRPDTQDVWFTDEDWEDPQFRAEIFRIIDEMEAIHVAEQAHKVEEERAKKNPRRHL